MSEDDLIRRLAWAICDYHKAVKVLQDTYEEAKTDLDRLHHLSLMISVERSRKKRRAVTRAQLTRALAQIREGSH